MPQEMRALVRAACPQRSFADGAFFYPLSREGQIRRLAWSNRTRIDRQLGLGTNKGARVHRGDGRQTQERPSPVPVSLRTIRSSRQRSSRIRDLKNGGNRHASVLESPRAAARAGDTFHNAPPSRPPAETASGNRCAIKCYCHPNRERLGDLVEDRGKPKITTHLLLYVSSIQPLGNLSFQFSPLIPDYLGTGSPLQCSRPALTGKLRTKPLFEATKYQAFASKCSKKRYVMQSASRLAPHFRRKIYDRSQT